MPRVFMTTLAEFAPGTRKIVEVGGRSIGIFNVAGQFYALRNRCPHQGGPLCEGRLWGILESQVPGEFAYTPRREILACPWHGWEFHVRTGQSWCSPTRLRARRYEVAVEEGTAPAADPDAPGPGLVRGPYAAETYPVAAEGRYLFVEVPG